jgi:hypothetical protein
MRSISVTEVSVLLVCLAAVGLLISYKKKTQGLTNIGTALWAWCWLMLLAVGVSAAQGGEMWPFVWKLAALAICVKWRHLEEEREPTGPVRRFAGAVLLLVSTSTVASVAETNAEWAFLATSVFGAFLVVWMLGYHLCCFLEATF